MVDRFVEVASNKSKKMSTSWQLHGSNYMSPCKYTAISSHLGAKLRDWTVRQAGAGCYFWAAMSSNDSKTRYAVKMYLKAFG